MWFWRRQSRPPDHADALGPLPGEALEALRLKAHRTASYAASGAHLRRRMGQSLDFREYRAYVPGDDIRHVDWQASARSGGPSDRVVRLFDAEEHMTILVLIDIRPTMLLPVDCQKITIAALLFRSIAWMAAQSRDRVIAVALGADTLEPETFAGGGLETRASDFCRRALDVAAARGAEVAPEGPLLPASLQKIPNAAFMVMISDFYFDDADGRLAELCRRVQRRHGLVFAVELDSWLLEAGLLDGRAIRFGGVDGHPGLDGPHDVRETDVNATGNAIEAHVDGLMTDFDHGGFHRTRWTLPRQEHLLDWFSNQLVGDSTLAHMLVRRR